MFISYRRRKVWCEKMGKLDLEIMGKKLDKQLAKETSLSFSICMLKYSWRNKELNEFIEWAIKVIWYFIKEKIYRGIK